MTDLTPYYIFCEGTRTEPLYFEGFKRHIEAGHLAYLDMINIIPCGRSSGSLLRQARRYVRAHEIERARIWLVYDKDDFPAADFDMVSDRVTELNAASLELSWHTAWSNQCFEFWLMLHFAYYRSNNSREDYVRFLNREFAARGLGRYEKNREDLFELLLEHGNPKLAMRHAQRIMTENKGRRPSEICPGTRVHELVLELAAMLPEEEKRLFI